MSDVINGLYGRSQHDTTASGGYVPTTTSAHTTEDVLEEAAFAGETTGEDGVTGSLTEIPSDKAESADEDEPAAEAEIVDEEQPAAAEAEADDAPAAVTAEAGAEDIDQPEEITAEARPAAATRGNTTVEDGVVAKVVDLLVRKAEGVHALAEDGISVDVDGEVVTVKISLVLEFGHAVKAVAERIRTSVIEAVEGFLGLDVAVVDVHVTDVHVTDAP